MNDSQLQDFLKPLGQGSSWAAKCVRRLLEAENHTDIAAGLVAQNGYKPVELVKDVWNAWGIDMKTCHSYCGRSNFPMVFDFPIFTSGVTNYLLPWLGLTAQLPYETGSPSGDFESFCLAVGSPMLTTFSLMSTAMNARTTSEAFTDLLKSDYHPTSDMKEAIVSAKHFLSASQQCPIRIQDDDFRKLFHDDEKRLHDQWVPLARRLDDTRRPYTFSLFAQTFFAVGAWVLTIIGSYVTSLGQHSEALLLSSGTLWTWLIPIVLGWMAVGMQSRPNTVQDALRGERINGKYDPMKEVRALKAESGFIRLPSKKMEDALLGKVQGDEAHQGPVYNYARILTYPKLRNRVLSAFEDKVKSLSAQKAQTTSFTHASHPDSASSRTRTSPTRCHNTTNNNSALPEDCSDLGEGPQLESGSNFEDDQPYMPWKDVRGNSDWVWNFVVSNAIAIFLQWGVTGSAIVISYLTEVRGIGCRSGSYLLYGILATSAHVLLLTSVFLSHEVMLGYQTELMKQAESVTHNGARSSKWIPRLAVAFRFFGKSIAIFNAIWIILSSIFELIGFYESCWCTGTVLGLGNRAWVVLFVSGDKMREEAEASWIGGLAMSLFTMILTYLVLKTYSQGRKN